MNRPTSMTPQHLRRETDRAIRAANGSTEERDSYEDRSGESISSTLDGLMWDALQMGATREYKRLLKAFCYVTGHAPSCLTGTCSDDCNL